jgi:hypothetical protein
MWSARGNPQAGGCNGRVQRAALRALQLFEYPHVVPRRKGQFSRKYGEKFPRQEGLKKNSRPFQ